MVAVRTFPLIFLFFGGALHAQLRVVDYNTAGAARDGMSTLLAAFGAESLNGVSKAPDVFTLEEQKSTTTAEIVSLLNGIYGAGTYARSTISGAETGTTGKPGLIYNTQTVQLIATTTASTLNGASGAARQTMRYELRPVGYEETADFYVYVSHYKASAGGANASRRASEAQQVRANADALGNGAHILYTGDFNVYASTEPMWTALTAAGAGQAFDPINRVGNWSNNEAFKDVHTQSPVTSSRYAGQVTGGMDDRFDYQLASAEFLDNEGLSYLPGSYHAFGNTGTHAFNGEINGGSVAALQARLPGYSLARTNDVLTALTTTSDHLPVVAQYQLPAKMKVVVGAVAPRVIVGAAANVTVTVSNVAPVAAAVGADELDYAVNGAGAVSGHQTGSVLALDPGEGVVLSLETGRVGAQIGNISVGSDSQQVANGDFSAGIGYQVLDHARPVFADTKDSTLTLDFGDVAQFSDAFTQAFSIENLVASIGTRAKLDLDAFQLSGAGVFFSDITLFSNLAPGDGQAFHVGLHTDESGAFHAIYTLTFSDEDLPGAAAAGTLTLAVTGRVTAVPEPGALALLALGGMVTWAMRRRLHFA